MKCYEIFVAFFCSTLFGEHTHATGCRVASYKTCYDSACTVDNCQTAGGGTCNGATTYTARRSGNTADNCRTAGGDCNTATTCTARRNAADNCRNADRWRIGGGCACTGSCTTATTCTAKCSGSSSFGSATAVSSNCR
ncbi:MAG: hypothetical protein Ta2A_15550 [Treponemataceae bacterium]|nr:MAG: hypothetical protein Ta2A_15550 [Treponemataceae bacterium]